MVVLIGAERYAMHGMLIPGLPKLLAYCDLHGRIRRRYLPKLDRHFVSVMIQTSKIQIVTCTCFFFPQVSQHIDPSEYTTAWFVKCYLDAVSLCIRTVS